MIPKVEAGLARLGVIILVEVLSMLSDLNAQFKRELNVLQGVKNVGVVLLHDLHGYKVYVRLTLVCLKALYSLQNID